MWVSCLGKFKDDSYASGEGLLKHGNVKMRRVRVSEDIKMTSLSWRGGTWSPSQEKEVRLS
jgi:hypothetical protein